jgi:uncharacterized membrane protein YbhN (UPF0104 family)
MTLLAVAIAAGTVVAIAAGYGFDAFSDAWSQVHFEWLALALVARIVIAGFGPSAPGGGFALDKRALEAVEGDEEAATLRVLALAALEWAVLAPAAWVSAVVLIATGDHRPMPSLLWPWAIAVPVGFVLGFWLAVPARRKRIAARGGRLRSGFAQGLRAIYILRSLTNVFSGCWLAWLGMTLYWALDIASFYGAVRFIGLGMNLAEVILAYATGYALTRRAMPLGGAGVTEALLTFSLHWVGQPVAPALAVVVVYRAFNFVLPAVPDMLVRPRVGPLLRAADRGETPAPSARRRAAAPLGPPRR